MIARAKWFLVWLALRTYAALFCTCVRIELDGNLYMRRWFLRGKPSYDGETGPPGSYLQRIYRADADRRLHNHPWELAHSRILRGCYKEVSRYLDFPAVTTTYRPGDVNVLTEQVFHRISAVSRGGVWTWFTASRKHGRSWGFR